MNIWVYELLLHTVEMLALSSHYSSNSSSVMYPWRRSQYIQPRVALGCAQILTLSLALGSIPDIEVGRPSCILTLTQPSSWLHSIYWCGQVTVFWPSLSLE
jgi:hypothetical protein